MAQIRAWTGADAAALQVILDNLRSTIRDGLRCSGEAVTSSIGAAELGRDELPDSWLHRADLALYQAKNSGRDCVVVADSPLATPVALLADEVV